LWKIAGLRPLPVTARWPSKESVATLIDYPGRRHKARTLRLYYTPEGS